MMKKIIPFILFLLAISLPRVQAAVDTVTIYSNSMHKPVKAVVITPYNYTQKKRSFPVVYLLHGYSGAFNNWITKVPKLQQMVDENQLIIVCPDGAFSSWYLDSPLDSAYRYETNVAIEVPAYIDAHYKTIPDRKHRAITGLSMGGHGGLFLGLRHADFFGACGSMSGVVDLHSSVNKYDISKRIGDTLHYTINWDDYSVINIIDHYPKDTLAMIIDCGTADPLVLANRNLHNKLLQLNIKHDYIERPGKHDWNYWGNAVKYQLLFFREFFNH